MALIEIPINSYRYHFRRLTWQEEARLKFPKGEDQRRILLAAALVDISGLPVTPEQALEALRLMPEAIIWRIFVFYGGKLPQNEYYYSAPIFSAPTPTSYFDRIRNEEHENDTAADAAASQLQHRISPDPDEENISRLMFRKAKESGSLTPAT